MEERYDVVIIGGGVGGLSAALVLGRARRRVVVVDAGRPRNSSAAHLQGFLTRDGARPSDVVSIGRAEVAAYGGRFVDARVRDLAACPDGFLITLEDGRQLTARRVLIATGLSDRLPDVPGVAERWGRDVLHCPYCHGYEFADQPLGVLNSSSHAVHQATMIRHWSSDVTLFTNGAALNGQALAELSSLGIDVVTTAVSRFVTDNDRLTGVRLVDGCIVPRTAMFVAPDLIANDRLPSRLGVATYDHPMGAFVWTDAVGRTTVPGVWAVGNVTDPSAQLITAAGDGSRAAIALNNDLIAQDADAEVVTYPDGGRRVGSPARRSASA